MISFAMELADAARDLVARAALPDPETKPDRSFVTATNLAVEDLLRAMISDRFPQHGILGEEGQDVTPGVDHVWVLDPIDGTAAFVAGVPVHGTLIALAEGGVPVLGVIDMHVTGQRWVGAAGHPTRLLHQGRSTDCRTRKGQNLDRAILSASNPDFFSAAERPALDALRERIGTGESVETAVARWDAFGAYMQGCMKVEKVTMRVATDYSAIVEAQANGDVQLHWAGPAAYAIGWDSSGGNMEPIAMDVSKDGELGYKWVVWVKADSPYQTMDDLKGKSLGWSTPGSASGYVLPMQYFRENGMVDANIEPVFFGSMVQTGSHDNGMVSVAQGTIDATTGWYYSPSSGAHTRAIGAGTIKEGDLRPVFESTVVPNAPFVVTKDLPEPMKATMQQCIVNMP